ARRRRRKPRPRPPRLSPVPRACEDGPLADGHRPPPGRSCVCPFVLLSVVRCSLTRADKPDPEVTGTRRAAMKAHGAAAPQRTTPGFEKLQADYQRFQEIERSLLDPEVTADATRVAALLRERGSLAKIAIPYGRYLELNRQVAEAEQLCASEADFEMRSYAE